MIAPSLITLASELFIISPSMTFEPATFPTFETLNISRISIEDKNWSVEFYLDLITKHDQGIEVLQFDNLSKKDSLFETNLISKEVDVENKDLTNFRYRISANFDFDAIPNNYPFDEQYLSISYRYKKSL